MRMGTAGGIAHKGLLMFKSLMVWSKLKPLKRVLPPLVTEHSLELE